jgi:hypothetical protein
MNLELVDASLDGTVTYELNIAPNLSNLNSRCLGVDSIHAFPQTELW